MKSSGAHCGDYVLKSGERLGATQLWELYVTRLKAEASYYQFKGTLGVMPMAIRF
jgi:hypothetical protein